MAEDEGIEPLTLLRCQRRFSRPFATIRATFRYLFGGRCWDRTNVSHFHGRRFSKPLHYRSANLPLIRKIDLIEIGAAGKESNLQPAPYERAALPFELQRRWLFGFAFSSRCPVVEAFGIEPNSNGCRPLHMPTCAPKMKV